MSSTRTAVSGLIAALALSCLCLAPCSAATATATAPPSLDLIAGRPVTWVDGDGVQWLAATFDAVSPDSAGGPLRLVVAKAGPYGDPWSEATVLDLAPPADGVQLEPLIAAGDAGTITTTWRDPSCTDPTTCTRTVIHVDRTGNVSASLTVPLSAGQPSRAMPDGSLLTLGDGARVGWITASGTAAPPVPVAAGNLNGTVDAAGRLVAVDQSQVLTMTQDGRVSRGPDLRTLCPHSDATVGRSKADDGYVIACRPPMEERVGVTRFDASGRQLWHQAAEREIGGLLSGGFSAVVDASGRAWVRYTFLGGNNDGAYGYEGVLTLSEHDAGSIEDRTTLYTVVSDKWSTSTLRQGPRSAGVTDIRPLTSGAAWVTLTEPYWNDNPPHIQIQGSERGSEVAVPSCTVGDLALAPKTATSLAVSFTSCAAADPWRQPTRYSVQTRGTFDWEWAEAATVPSAPWGTRIRTSVPVTPTDWDKVRVVAVNDAGAADRWDIPYLDFVAPYPSVEDFVSRQYRDFAGSVPSDEPAKSAAAIREIHSTYPLQDLWLSAPKRLNTEAVSRLYLELLGRLPDRSGLASNLAKLEAGSSQATVASGLIRSAEFRRRHGSLTNEGFIRLLYQFQGTKPSTWFVGVWTERLRTGRTTRAAAAAQFASTENAKYLGDKGRSTVVSLTYLMLHRVPSSSEVTAELKRPGGWRGASTILASSEYAATVPR